MNPQSGNRRAERQWLDLEGPVREACGDVTLFRTAEPGDATRLVRSALRDGYDRIISAGGDGTHYEVVNGFFEKDSPINPEASIAILPIGTASDFRKTLRLPKPADSVVYLGGTTVYAMDVGKVTSTDEHGETMVRYFNTAVHIGLGGLVGEHVNRRSKALGGFMTFYVGVITALMAYTWPKMRVTVDGKVVKEGKMLEVIAANGEFDGGGMHVAPHARLDDGLLEMYAMGNIGRLGSFANSLRIYKGTHDQHEEVIYLRTPSVRVDSDERVIVSPDGELAGFLPATVEIVPKAVRMVVGEGTPIG